MAGGWNDEDQFPRNHFSSSLSNISGVVPVFQGAGRVHRITVVGGTNAGFLGCYTFDEAAIYQNIRCRTADSTPADLPFYAASGLKVQFTGTGQGRVNIWWS